MLYANYPCYCRGYDPADPCTHGDTSAACPRHDLTVMGDDARDEYDEDQRWADISVNMDAYPSASGVTAAQ